MMLTRDLNAVAIGIPRGLFLTEPLSLGQEGITFSRYLGNRVAPINFMRNPLRFGRFRAFSI